MEMLKDFYEFLVEILTDWPYGTIIVLVSSLVIITVLVLIADQFCGKYVTRSGVVIEKSYTPSSTGTGVGPSIGGSGGVAVVVTSSSETYTLFIERNNGEIDNHETDRDTWLRAKVGDKITYRVWVGRFLGA